MGRKPLPDDQKKQRVVMYLTAPQVKKLEQFASAELGGITVTNNNTEPLMVRLPVMPLDDENRDRVIYDSRAVVPLSASSDHNAIPITPRTSGPSITLRECGICGKDYDGEQYDSCPHDHVPNGKRK